MCEMTLFHRERERESEESEHVLEGRRNFRSIVTDASIAVSSNETLEKPHA